MNSARLWLVVAAVIVFAVLVASHYHGGSFQTPRTQSLSAPWSHGRDGSQANAEEHWEKHGREFSQDRSEADYVRQANAFVHRPPPDTLIKHDARGDTLFYQPSTDTFAVMDAAGEPRTFFKPDNGLSYWNKQ